MSEKINIPTWAVEIKAAMEKWHEAAPEKRSVFAISVGEDEDGNLSVNASIIGNAQFLLMGAITVMNDETDINKVGSLLRAAAMKHLMSKAQYAGKIEITVGDDTEAATKDETNTESHE